MSVRHQHSRENNSFFFITFTCIKWKPLFEISQSYNAVYKWFDFLKEKKISTCGYVIMPNHLHALLHFPSMLKSINSIVSNAKRFMAYQIIKNLECKGELKLLDELSGLVTKNEKKKGQIHKVFEDSFDAKLCSTREFILQKLNYMHHNPVSKKWTLVNDFTHYKHSSAGFYEKGEVFYQNIIHVAELW